MRGADDIVRHGLLHGVPSDGKARSGSAMFGPGGTAMGGAAARGGHVLSRRLSWQAHAGRTITENKSWYDEVEGLVPPSVLGHIVRYGLYSREDPLQSD